MRLAGYSKAVDERLPTPLHGLAKKQGKSETPETPCGRGIKGGGYSIRPPSIARTGKLAGCVHGVPTSEKGAIVTVAGGK